MQKYSVTDRRYCWLHMVEQSAIGILSSNFVIGVDCSRRSVDVTVTTSHRPYRWWLRTLVSQHGNPTTMMSSLWNIVAHVVKWGAGIATRYGLDGPGIESRWGEIFRTYPDRLRGPSSLLCNGYRVFPGGKGGRGVMLTTHPVLVPRLRKSWAIPPLNLWVLLGLLRGSLYPFT